MTLRQLFETPWNCMTDRPKINYPWRAKDLAKTSFQSDNGAPYNARVITNRTKNRFWLEIVHAGGGFMSLRLYLTTTSQKKADIWISALQNGWA